MINRAVPAIALSAMLALVSGAARANLISDGNFSLGVSSSGTYTVGETLGDGAWTVTTGLETNVPGYSGIDLSYNSGDWQAPPSGGSSVDLDAYYPGGVTQTFATTAGDDYWVSFYLAGNPSNANNPNPIKQLQVTAESTTEDYSFDTSSTTTTNMGYVLEAFQFVATSDTTTLTFTSLDPSTQASGPVIGGVDVEAPEPASLALLLVGGFGIGLVRRHRSKIAAC